MVDDLGMFPSLDPATGKLRPIHVPVSDDGASKEDLEKFQEEINLIDGVFWAGEGSPTAAWIAAVRASGKTPLDLKQVRKGDRIVNPRQNSSHELLFDIQTYHPLTGAMTTGLHNVGNVQGDQGDDAYKVAQSTGYVGTKDQWIASLKGRDGSNVLPTDEAIDNALNVSSSIFNVTQLRRAR